MVSYCWLDIHLEEKVMQLSSETAMTVNEPQSDGLSITVDACLSTHIGQLKSCQAAFDGYIVNV